MWICGIDTEMINRQISESLHCEITSCTVKLTRRHTFKGWRTVFLKKDIVLKSATFANDLLLDDGKEKTLFEEDGWRVTVSEFLGKMYISYITLDSKGKRVYPSSMNISLEEYGIIRDLLSDEVHPEDIAPEAGAPLQPVHWNMIPVYKWKFEEKEGEVIRTSPIMFLNRENCVQHGIAAGQDLSEHCEMKIEVHEVLPNTMEELLKKVYGHLLYQEFNWRVKQQCYGCLNDRDSQKDHMSGGCLDDREVLVELHAMQCHLRVSERRLHEAARVVMSFFSISSIDRFMVSKCLKSVYPKQVLLTKDCGVVYYEFDKLYKF